MARKTGISKRALAQLRRDVERARQQQQKSFAFKMNSDEAGLFLGYVSIGKMLAETAQGGDLSLDAVQRTAAVVAKVIELEDALGQNVRVAFSEKMCALVAWQRQQLAAQDGR